MIKLRLTIAIILFLLFAAWGFPAESPPLTIRELELTRQLMETQQQNFVLQHQLLAGQIKEINEKIEQIKMQERKLEGGNK